MATCLCAYLYVISSRNTPQIRLTCFAEEEQNEEIGNETGSLQTDEDRADDEPKGPSTEESITQDSPVSKHV